jgi:Fur family ferric uptake transcriptional regulator
MTTSLIDALDHAGCRITGPRRAVASLIAERRGHFTAADIVAGARQRYPGIGRATVFRTLDLFASLKLVERVDLPDGDHAYVTCDRRHHHHAICNRCGRSLDLADTGLARLLQDVGNELGFRITSHRLELFGICATCQIADDA